MRVGNALDEAVQTQTSEVVSHAPLGEFGWRDTQQVSQRLAQVFVGKTLRQQGKQHDDAEQRLYARVIEAQGRGSLAGNGDGLYDLLKSVFAERAIMADALDVQKASVGVEADLPQGGEVVQPFADGEVAGVVDRGLDAQCAPFFVVLLDPGAFIVDVQRGDNALGEYARPKGAWSLAASPTSSVARLNRAKLGGSALVSY